VSTDPDSIYIYRVRIRWHLVSTDSLTPNLNRRFYLIKRFIINSHFYLVSILSLVHILLLSRTLLILFLHITPFQVSYLCYLSPFCYCYYDWLLSRFPPLTSVANYVFSVSIYFTVLIWEFKYEFTVPIWEFEYEGRIMIYSSEFNLKIMVDHYQHTGSFHKLNCQT
jgi:hypothetical protein